LAATGDLVKERNFAALGSFEIENPTDFFLEPETEYIYTVEVSVRKRPYRDTDEEKKERRVIRFTTGNLPNVILPSNLRSAYPYDGMVNMYRGEYDQGRIILNREQPNVTDSLTAVWEDNRGQKTTSNVMVSSETIRFDIPQNWLHSRRQYKLSLVQNYRAPESTAAGGGTDNPSDTETDNTFERGAGGVNYMIEVPDLEYFMVQDPERTVFECYFRVSRYRTFEQKVIALTTGIEDGPADQLPQAVIEDKEGWSVEELQPSWLRNTPLVSVEISSDVSWPDPYFLDNVLPSSGSIRLHDPMGYGNFDNLTLSSPKKSIYFKAPAEENYPPPVGVGTFDADDYSATISGQVFVMGYPKIVGNMFTKFMLGLTSIPNRVLTELGDVQEIDANGETILSGIAEAAPCLENPTRFYDRDPAVTPQQLSSLQGNWKTQSTVYECPIDQRTRMALREMGYFDIANSNYRNRDFSVNFTYYPPGMSSRTITRTIQIP
jgi:hypothetical protein